MNDAVAIVGGRIHCMDARGGVVDALAFREGAIRAIGDRDSVLAEAGENATVVDVGGALVLPGFVDAHHHVSVSALYGGLQRLTPPRVHDIRSFQEALAEASRRLAPGRWLVAMDWDEQLLAERRPPTRAELDDAVGDRPLFALHYSCHRALANSRALEAAQIGRDTPDPSGGVIARGRRGLPSGLLIERGMSRVEAMARTDLLARDVEGYLERMAHHYRSLVSVGITSVADTAVPLDLLPLYRDCARRGDVLVPTSVCLTSANGYLEEPWDLLDAPKTGEEIGPLTIGPVKLVFDGAPVCSMCLGWWQFLRVAVRTCLLAMELGSLAPIRTSMSVKPRFGRKVRSGVAIYRAEEADRVVSALVERGFAVATHAVGNEAARIALDAYAAVGPSIHDAGPARLEHGSFLDRGLVARVADLGVTVVAQPSMLAMPSYASAPSVPGMPFFALRTLLDAGVRVAGSSDYPVVGFDPLDGVRAAVSRATLDGRIVDGAERVTVLEAIAMFTRDAAAACGSLSRTGTLEVGKRADFVVLDGELDDLASLRVRETVVAGATLFRRPTRTDS
jgi:predicted amidohydrolase YtcJ